MRRSLNRTGWPAALLLCIICTGCGSDPGDASSDAQPPAPETEPERVIDPGTAELIARLEEIAEPLPREPMEFQELNDRYITALRKAGALLGPVVQRHDFDQLCRLIDEVGHHDQYVDFLILFSMEIIVFPAPLTFVPHPRSEDPELADTMNEARLLLSDCIVRRMKDDDRFYEQYYWSVMWMRRLRLNSEGGLSRLIATMDEMTRADPTQESWYCRNVFIMAKLLSREELVDDLDCDDAVEVLAELGQWSTEKYAYLRAHPDEPKWTVSKWPQRGADGFLSFEPPDRPLPDWTGPAPSFDLLSGFEIYLKLDR